MTDTTATLPTAVKHPAFLAFHSDPAIKAKYLGRVEAHQAADKLVQGYGYWKDGKGCAVGCTIHGSNHKAYETELGIPEALARLEDTIFEGLPVEEARAWPARFLAAIAPGADLSRVPWQMVEWLLTKEIPATKNEAVEAVRTKLLALFQPLIDGAPYDRAPFRAALPEFRRVREDAWAARRAAWNALDAARLRRRRAASSAQAAAAVEAAAAAAVEAAAVEAAAVEAVEAAAVAAAAAAAAVAAAEAAA